MKQIANKLYALSWKVHVGHLSQLFIKIIFKKVKDMENRLKNIFELLKKLLFYKTL